MEKKMYEDQENAPMRVGEPAVAYRTTTPKIQSSAEWNPNVPFHGTQEEWWEHFRRIEEGEFMTIEEADRRFDAWKKEYLASLT